MELFVFWLIMAGVVAFVANSKGQSGGLWFLYGLILWPIALIHAIVIQKNPEAIERQNYNEGKIRCPNCADWVYKQAKTCPHCQHRLTAKPQVQPVALSKTVKESLTIENEEGFWQGDRNLDAASYKLHLSEKFDIKKNELFEQYVCLDEMFDTLDEALAHADKTDRERQAELRVRVVRRGKIGLNDLAYEEIATGEVTVTGPDGEKAKFESEKSAFKFFNAYMTKSKELAAFKERAKGEADA